MPEKPRRCFVVMGFGIKTDYATGRKLDLNKSYRLLIKPVVEGLGLECIRADEIRHSGSIDLPMYKELLKADVVVADLSTANVNAFYELGIRHALRPYTTVVISEDKLTYPFDLNHIKITSYTHLGDAIDYEEVERFRKELSVTLQAVLNSKQFDSPVYTYLDGLVPPRLQDQLEEALADTKDEKPPAPVPKKRTNNAMKTLSLLAEQGEEAIRNKEYTKAKALFNSALLIGKTEKDAGVSHDSYLIHRLVYATYNAKIPDEVSALEEGLDLLHQLDLAHTNDSETVAIAGRIKKRLYFAGEGDQHLFDGIQFYERAYFLLHNRYNGTNLAFLINHRPETKEYSQPHEIIADLVLANRIRREVLNMCEKDWQRLESKQGTAKEKLANENPDLAASQKQMENEQRFWILVNRAEAHFGLGEMDAYNEAKLQASQLPHEPWMMASFEDQVEKLRVVLQKHGHLLQPVWMEA
ncbi:MAG TPA: tetratricopeptide repeat-containing protein [Flavisolibacter sp.]|jgi:hypothetical protein|nr:tetratricopeptide repeat-containing protein [Flavisolibacter sp.]